MTTSNIKFRPGSKEAPTEPFKRSVSACLKAIAKKPELEVSFAAERPGLAPGKARLPEPARKMTKRDAAIVRGHADSIALKIACHDPKVHRKLMPGNPQARGVFEAVEQARVEAIGSRRMAGVAKNLTAMLDDHFHRGKYDEITDRADAPLSDALAMLVRERLTGMAPPAAAKKMVDLWRPTLEDKIGSRLDKLSRFTEDQARFGDLVHDLLSALDLGDDRNMDSDDDDDQDENQDGESDQSGAEGSPDSDAAQEMSADQAQTSAEEMSESAMESAQASTSDTFDDGELGDDETPGEATRPNARGQNEPRGSGISRLRAEVRRGDRRRGSLRSRRARAAALLSRQAARASAGHRGAARQSLAAPADGAAEPRLGVRSRGGHPRSGAAVARRHRSLSSAVLHAREGGHLPRHRGDAAAG
ncbi:cobaltochelatase CobT subunit [Bradyrhizobium elkanii]